MEMTIFDCADLACDEFDRNKEEYYFGMAIFIGITLALFLIICFYVYFWVMVNSFRSSVINENNNSTSVHPTAPPYNQFNQRPQRPVYVMSMPRQTSNYYGQLEQHYPNYSNYGAHPVTPSQIPPINPGYAPPSY